MVPTLRTHITGLALDVDFYRPDAAASKFEKLSKLELMYLCLSSGYRAVEGKDIPLTSDGDLVVCPQNLLRSRKYLEALAVLPDIFARGVPAVSHEVDLISFGQNLRFGSCRCLWKFVETPTHPLPIEVVSARPTHGI